MAAGCSPTEVITADPAISIGLVLVEAVISVDQIPGFDNTAVDGFAVRASDVSTAPVELSIVGEIAAGQQPSIEVGPGQAVRIMTGAPVPPGADAIVMVEDTEVIDAGTVRVTAPSEPGRHLRRAGEDLQSGEVAVAAGTVITPAVLGVLANVGATEVVVHRRPLVGVFSTGDELVTDGSRLRLGQIRDSNRPQLLALVSSLGCDAVDLGCLPDDEVAIEAGIGAGVARCDALVTSGGVSMGDYDFVKVVLGRIAEMRWMQVAIKPAKPLAFGTIDGVPVFGLPGNPVSSLVSFELFARVGLRRMMGHQRLDLPRVWGRAAVDLPRHADGKIHFLRATREADKDGYHVRPVAAQGSHQLTATALADTLVVLPDGDGVGAGDLVELLLLRADD